MDWEMIIVFFVMMIFFGAVMGWQKNSVLAGFAFFLMGLGLISTAAIIMLTGYDGIWVWVVGIFITYAPFLLLLKFKYPEKYVQLQKDMKF